MILFSKITHLIVFDPFHYNNLQQISNWLSNLSFNNLLQQYSYHYQIKSEMSDKTEKILYVVKWTNIITSIAIIAFGITGLIYIGITSLIAAKFFLVFSPIFMTLFGIVLLATQCKIDFILKRVGILRSLAGRGIFNIYLASEVFFYFSCGSGNGVLGWVFGVALFILGIFYLVLQFCVGGAYSQQLKQRLG